MEMGSFIELEYPNSGEYYTQGPIARLNTGRAAVYHALRAWGVRKVLLPYYECATVRDFLVDRQIDVSYYALNEEFTPVVSDVPEDTAIVLVNYFGIMGVNRMKRLSAPFAKVIVDNAQAFFAPPLDGCLNIYSARKFVGVPDGAYVLGEHADRFVEEYPEDFSSDTADFLLKRLEYGCEGKAYDARMKNEARLDEAGARSMSRLTRRLLAGIDYETSKRKRLDNFRTACALFDQVNRIDPKRYLDNTCVPMVYPLVVEEDGLLERLIKAGHFQGRWWAYLLEERPPESFEYYLSRYGIPVTIDQRYGPEELSALAELIKGGRTGLDK